MELSLLHAGLAAGAALAAIPVILHLFMKQTPKHVIFPALRLIRERQKRSRKKLRVKNWLLLLARMAVLALMALALARPAMHSQTNLGDREVPTALALVFDTSLSMEYVEKHETRLAEAKQRADEILKKTPDSSQVFVIDSAEPGVPPPLSPAAARKRIEGLAIRDANRPLNTAIGQAYRAVAESDKPRHEVYVLTDLARSSWELDRPVEGLDAARKVKTGISTYVLRLTPKGVHDVAVVDAQPAAGVATQGEPVEVKAKLRASGAAAKGRVVEFLIDKVKREQKTVELAADGEAEVTFKTPNLPAGLHQGEVHVAGTDPMEFDDHRFFSLHVQPALKVLVVYDKQIDADFVVEALDPTKLRATSARPYRVDRVVSTQLIAKMKDSLKDYACVFLLNVQQLAESEWSRLNAYVREGGGLVIGLGDRVNAENYNSRIAALVVPATLIDHKPPPEPVTFGKADFNHPLFRRYARDLDADLSGVPVYNYWTIKPSEQARAILSYQDSAPALVERIFKGAKTGNVLLWTTPLSRRADLEDKGSWNDFPEPRFWSFFYMMNQSVPYLAGTADEKLNYEAGQDVIIPVDTTRRFSSYTVQGPGNPTPERHSPPVSNPQLVIPAPQKVGQWSVTATGQGQTPQTLGFSINPPESESRISALVPKDLDALFGKDKYALADDTESLKRIVQVGRVGRELFPWIMALILALVTAENFLANRFYRERVAKSQ